MSWADLQAMLANAANEPVFVVVGAVLVFAVGILAGTMTRRQEAEWSETGDTQAAMIESGWVPPLPTPALPPPPPRRVHVPNANPPPTGPRPAAPPPPRARIRAGSIDGTRAVLKPSYISPEQRRQR